MPNLVYTSADFPFVPFTKIYSADINQSYNDIKTLLNITGLDDVNVQVNGLTRIGASSRLKTGTVNAIMINNNSTGNMAELASVNNAAVYFNSSGVPTAASLPLAGGGTGQNLAITQAGDVLQVDPTGTVITLAPPASIAAPLRVFNYFRFG